MRGIPPVHRFLSEPRIAAYEALLGREYVKRCVGAVLDAWRSHPELPEGIVSNPDASFDALCARLLGELERGAYELLTPVINGTGVLLHTNLGRAPLAAPALAAVSEAGSGYSNLEYDLAEGRRGSRYARTTLLLQSITGAEDALIVNNCAAAVLLMLDTFAKGREVVVARNELIEIGGGFRIPDVLERSGARLVEVGTTNKVYLKDYERALTPDTALILRTHPSNFRIRGFTQSALGSDLGALGKRTGIPVVEDLGSGALVDLAEYGLPYERTVQEALGEQMDLVAFSGDKILGGPQAGIIVGRKALIARMRSNPLLRALRVDKLTLAALGQTLRLHFSRESRKHIPLFAMADTPLRELRTRAERYAQAVSHLSVIDTKAYVGGGTLPESAFPSVGVSLHPKHGADAAARELRRASTPIIARIEDGRLVLDLRTIFPADDDRVIAALRALSA